MEQEAASRTFEKTKLRKNIENLLNSHVDPLANDEDDLRLGVVGGVLLILLENAEANTDVHGDDVHGIGGTLGEISEAGHQLRVVVDDCVLYVEIEDLA